MNEGTIKWYNETKGFGFIVDDSGKDIFVHRSGINAHGVPDEGQKVEFETQETEKGLTAVNVSLL